MPWPHVLFGDLLSPLFETWTWMEMDVFLGQNPIPFIFSSGKHTKNYGKSQFFMDKSTISTGPFSSSQTVNVYQRLYHIKSH